MQVILHKTKIPINSTYLGENASLNIRHTVDHHRNVKVICLGRFQSVSDSKYCSLSHFSTGDEAIKSNCRLKEKAPQIQAANQ